MIKTIFYKLSLLTRKAYNRYYNHTTAVIENRIEPSHRLTLYDIVYLVCLFTFMVSSSTPTCYFVPTDTTSKMHISCHMSCSSKCQLPTIIHSRAKWKGIRILLMEQWALDIAHLGGCRGMSHVYCTHTLIIMTREGGLTSRVW